MKLFKNRFFLMITLLLLPLLLLACGGEDEDDDNGDDNGDNNVEETGADLSQSFTATAQGASVTFQHPEGWAAAQEEATGQIYIANSAETLDSIQNDPDYAPAGDQVGMVLVPFPAASMGADATPASVLEMMGGETGLAEGGVTELTVDGKAISKIEIAEEGNTGAGYAVSAEDGYILFMALVADDYAQYEAIATAILASASVSAEEAAEPMEETPEATPGN
ncbi:MAG: hypothetical protein HC915_19635 [Anaerolineae bacterium]|nr:hypothetical protein [Anaerolineae bacterium]